MSERNMDQLPPVCALTGWGLNPQPFGVQNNVPTNSATWPGPGTLFLWLLLGWLALLSGVTGRTPPGPSYLKGLPPF